MDFSGEGGCPRVEYDLCACSGCRIAIVEVNNEVIFRWGQPGKATARPQQQHTNTAAGDRSAETASAWPGELADCPHGPRHIAERAPPTLSHQYQCISQLSLELRLGPSREGSTVSSELSRRHERQHAPARWQGSSCDRLCVEQRSTGSSLPRVCSGSVEPRVPPALGPAAVTAPRAP